MDVEKQVKITEITFKEIAKYGQQHPISCGGYCDLDWYQNLIAELSCILTVAHIGMALSYDSSLKRDAVREFIGKIQEVLLDD